MEPGINYYLDDIEGGRDGDSSGRRDGQHEVPPPPFPPPVEETNRVYDHVSESFISSVTGGDTVSSLFRFPPYPTTADSVITTNDTTCISHHGNNNTDNNEEREGERVEDRMEQGGINLVSMERAMLDKGAVTVDASQEEGDNQLHPPAKEGNNIEKRKSQSAQPQDDASTDPPPMISGAINPNKEEKNNDSDHGDYHWHLVSNKHTNHDHREEEDDDDDEKDAEEPQTSEELDQTAGEESNPDNIIGNRVRRTRAQSSPGAYSLRSAPRGVSRRRNRGTSSSSSGPRRVTTTTNTTTGQEGDREGGPLAIPIGTPPPAADEEQQQQQQQEEALAMANPVDDIDPDLPRAEDYHQDPQAAAAAAALERRKQRTDLAWKIALAVAVLALLIVIPVIVVAASLSSTNEAAGSSDHNSKEEEEEASALWSTPEDLLATLLEVDHPQTATAITMETPEESSPQGRAFQWLLEDEFLTHLSLDRIRQKFALATLFYSTGGGDGDDDNSWIESKFWLNHRVHECYWFNSPDYARKGIIAQAYPTFMEGFMEPLPTEHCDDDGFYEHLWLDQNNLVGVIPTELYMITTLKSVTFMANKLEGNSAVSSYIGQLSNLEGFEIAGNSLTGSLPTEIGLLTRLQSLHLGRNQLTGRIPSELSKLTDMLHLSLFANPDLGGTLPSELGLWLNLDTLIVAACNLTGTIPTEVGLINHFKMLYADGNSLNGTIPSQFGVHREMFMLHLRDNSLSGSIPTELGLLTSTTLLNLARSQLSGPVPSELGQLTELSVTLNLNGNELSGTIPTDLGRLTNLVEIDLSHNQMTGPIPTELAKITVLGHLGIANNTLSGTVPDELLRIKHVFHALRLEGNPGLSGSIPSNLCILNGTCIPNAWERNLCDVANNGLSFDCTGLLCGCDCNCTP